MLLFACFGLTACEAQSEITPEKVLVSAGAAQGVAVVWEGGPYRYDYDKSGGSANDADIESIRKVALGIARELQMYPSNFLRESGISEIVLVKDLFVEEEGDARNAAGYIFDGRYFVDVPFALQALDKGTRVRFIHHVLYHQLDENAGTLWDDDQWVSLNPPGFEYGVYSAGGVHEKRAGTGSLSDVHEGFLNVYSTGNVPDDKAEVFAYLMVLHEWMLERANQDDYLRAKIELVKSRLAALDTEFGEPYWNRVNSDSDDAAAYMR